MSLGVPVYCCCLGVEAWGLKIFQYLPIWNKIYIILTFLILHTARKKRFLSTCINKEIITKYFNTYKLLLYHSLHYISIYKNTLLNYIVHKLFVIVVWWYGIKSSCWNCYSCFNFNVFQGISTWTLIKLILLHVMLQGDGCEFAIIVFMKHKF